MRKFFSSSAKGSSKPIYRHKWNQDDDPDQGASFSTTDSVSAGSRTTHLTSSGSDTDQKPRPTQIVQERRFFKSRSVAAVTAPSVTNTAEEPRTRVRRHEFEKLYTVVKKVKQAHQCHESGEVQDITGDIDYLLSSVVDAKNNRVKCLGVVNIASKCQSAQFRSHLRAHGYSTKLFEALIDSYKTPSLALCTACVIYLLARDRLSFTVDQPTLKLIVDLISLSDKSGTSAAADPEANIDTGDDDYEEYHTQVWNILKEWRQQAETSAAFALNQKSKLSDDPSDDGSSSLIMFDITLENLSARFLAVEALTFICCRTNGDWFQKGMRDLRGLDCIAQYFCQDVDVLLDLDPKSTAYVTTATELVKMLERYLRILEHMTFMNQQNQAYMVVWQSSALIKQSAKLFKYLKSILLSVGKASAENELDESTMLSPKIVKSVLMAVFKSLLNLSHGNELCCGKLGEADCFMKELIDFVTRTLSECVPAADRFDLLVLSLGLVVNLVEPCNANRRIVINHVLPTGESTIVALCKAFLFYESAAQAADSEVEREIESSQEIPHATLKKVNKHMEDSIASSHYALLLGLILQQNETVIAEISSLMPDGKVEPLIAMLQKFLDFMKLTNGVGRTGEKTINKAIEALETMTSCVN